MEIRSETKAQIIGALGATASYLGTYFLVKPAGLYQYWVYKDGAGRTVIGFGSDDLINLGAGAGMLVGGQVLERRGQKRGSFIKNMGFTWLLTYGCIKLSELFPYLVSAAPAARMAVQQGTIQPTAMGRTTPTVGLVTPTRGLSKYIVTA